MAFDRPLESDRVDDLSFFGLLSQGPIIGSIMWILGGKKAMDEQEKELQQQRDLELLLKDTQTTGGAMENTRPLQHSNSSNGQRVSKSALRKSDTLTDCANALDEMTVTEKPLKRQRKNISWSDEGGKDLVEFIGQIKSCSVPVSDSTCSSSDAAVIKNTMMPRSTSMGHRMMESHQDEPEAVFLPLALHKRVEQMSAEPRYLPRGLEKAHNGIRVPRMPSYAIEPAGSSGSAEGVESPQWGWWVRTTPPTPQMYSRYHQKSDASMASAATDSSSHSSSTVPGSHPNPVFQGMQDKHKAVPMGWSSVPL